MSGTEELRAALARAQVAFQRARSPEERAAICWDIIRLVEEHPELHADVAPLIPPLLADKHGGLRRAGVRLGALVLDPSELESFLPARLADPSAEVRMEAAGQLADLASPSSRGALAAALEDDEFSVRFEAARGMAALQHAAGLDVLVEGLGKTHYRFRALGAVGELADPRALEPVRAVFHRWLLNYFERTQAAAVLAKLGDQEGARYLVQRTRARRAADRLMAIELCGEVQPPGGLERVREILLDRADPGRGAAARGLGRSRAKDAEELLARVLAEPDLPEDVALDVAEGLLLLGSESSREAAKAAAGKLASDAARRELATMLEEYSP